MNFIKILFFLFLISITTNVFGKSREYYEHTVIHILTASNSSNQKQVFEQEIKYLFYQLFESLLEKIKIELLDEQGKEDKFI